MIPLPDDITAKDVNQWLEGGIFYCKLKGFTEPLICRLLSVEPQGLARVQVLTTGEICITRYTKMYAFWPTCGSLNIEQGKFAVSLMRQQLKQWKRTYNSNCLTLRPISENPNHFTVGPDSDEIVLAAFRPQYFSYKEVLQTKFPEGWTSCALTPNLIVLKTPQLQMVFVDGEVVGTIDASTHYFKCVSSSLKRRLLPHLDFMVG